MKVFFFCLAGIGFMGLIVDHVRWPDVTGSPLRWMFIGLILSPGIPAVVEGIVELTRTPTDKE